MTLWVFGDSFSCSFSSDYIFTNVYTTFKGYVPKIYVELIADEFNYELKNFAKAADNNYGIFHTFLSQVENIKKDDVVIIQFSSIYRYRLVNKDGEFESIASHWDNQHGNFNESKESIMEIGLNRTAANYKEEIDDWVKTAKLLLKNNKIIFWSPFIESTGNKDVLPFYQFTDITVETNNVINDHHYGEIGHKELSDYIMKSLFTKKTII